MPKMDKKSWKERQRAIQKAQEEDQKRREQAAMNKPRKKLPKGKIIFGLCLITIILASYGTWQYVEGQKPPTIGGNSDIATPSNAQAPNFSLQDINGTKVSLSKYSGKVVGIHFMAVGCSGQIDYINQYQLAQLSSACNSLCGKKNATFVTVAVATCENSRLDMLRSTYGVNWIMGNDYSDGALEIVNSYVPFQIGDGTVVLIDKNSTIAQVYNRGVTSSMLISKMNELGA